MTVLPKFTRYVGAFAIFTVVFGVGMVAVIANGDFSVFSLSTALGLYVSIGAALAVVAIAVAFAVAIPAANKLVKIIQTLAKNPGPPPPELISASNRLRLSSTAVMVLLIVVTFCMVASATL